MLLQGGDLSFPEHPQASLPAKAWKGSRLPHFRGRILELRRARSENFSRNPEVRKLASGEVEANSHQASVLPPTLGGIPTNNLKSEAAVNVVANLGPESHRIGVCMASSLHSAAAQGDGDIVTALLEAGASVDAVDRQGGTLLHVAAGQGHADVVTALSRRAPAWMRSTCIMLQGKATQTS